MTGDPVAKALPVQRQSGCPLCDAAGGRVVFEAADFRVVHADEAGFPAFYRVVWADHVAEFSELDAAQLPRALPDLDAAVINTDHALNAGLDIRKDTIAVEKREGNPYANFVAARQGDTRPEIKTFVEAYQSPEVAKFLEQRFKGAIIPAW